VAILEVPRKITVSAFHGKDNLITLNEVADRFGVSPRGRPTAGGGGPALLNRPVGRRLRIVSSPIRAVLAGLPHELLCGDL
jgi:hypothetical protein